MFEALSNAKEELKRVDHQLYVSLKYTRTVDVFKNLIDRIINCYLFSFNALLIYMKEKKKIPSIPDTPIAKANLILKLFSEDKIIIDGADVFLLLRKINKSEYIKAQEFRRHVSMTVIIEDKSIEVNIDVLYEYYEGLKTFLSRTEEIIKND